MPNIAVTSHCNLRCPYCFASQMFDDVKINNITIEQFDKILKWIEPYAIEDPEHSRIGIIGGEPTLHPDFETLMEHTSAFCLKYNLSSILFTNAIELKIDKIKTIPDNMRVLINCNHPSVYGTGTKLEQFYTNLDILYTLGLLGYDSHKITLGCTLCDQIDDYSFFYELINKYHCKFIRTAIDKTGKKFNDKEYLLKMKIKFLSLIDYAIKADVKDVYLDCRIPLSFFDENEQNKIFQVIKKESYIGPCYPAFEIFPDFTASGCFTFYNQFDCTQYSSFKEMINKENRAVMTYE